VSRPRPGDNLVEAAVGEILADAAVVRADGRLPAGFEDELGRRFDSIAADPRSLERAVEAGALSARQLYRFPTEETPSRSEVREFTRRSGVPPVLAAAGRRSARAAEGLSRKGMTTARRVAGPNLRSLERRTIDQLGGAAEALATRGHVAADHVRRLASSGGTSRRYVRLSPSGRALPAGLYGTSIGASSMALGAGSSDPAVAALEEWIVERIKRGPGGCVLHVECRAGALVRRLNEAGFGAVGADPTAEESETITRAGAVERLGAQRRSSLGGLVLSGVTERVSPGSARALVHLSSTRLTRGGIAVVVSAHPDRLYDSDPITSDLAVRRPVHPVTWCHLFARYGFGQITVLDPFAEDRSGDQGSSSVRSGDAGALYAVGARRE
jgi:hypothetical protein